MSLSSNFPDTIPVSRTSYRPLTIALPKGRMLHPASSLLEKIGIIPEEPLKNSRRLLVRAPGAEAVLLIVRATDVPVYVRFGAADVGIAGRDVLWEDGAEGIYMPVDLGMGVCRMVVAGKADANRHQSRYRVATKYPVSTRRYFSRHHRHADIITLHGNLELAPLVGLADCIVDLVETGTTLRENGLVEWETIAPISSRLIVNRASLKTRHTQVQNLIDAIRVQVDADAREKHLTDANRS